MTSTFFSPSFSLAFFLTSPLALISPSFPSLLVILCVSILFFKVMPNGAENGKSLEKQTEWCQATAFFLPTEKHANVSPSHLCCTSSSHKCGGYKWRYAN